MNYSSPLSRSSVSTLVGMPILIAIAALTALSWMWDPAPPTRVVSSIRVVIAGALIFFAPGVLALRLPSAPLMPWQAGLAVSAALSMCVAALLIPVPFLVGGGIRTYATTHLAGLLAMAVAALIMGLRRPSRISGFQGRPRPPAKRIDWGTSTFHAVTIILLAGATFQFGEHVGDIGFEKLLHLQFVRFYFEREARLVDLGYMPGAVPPNIVHYWEYVVAAWAAMIHSDPLPLFERVRFVVPVIGMSAMYLLIWAIFPRRRADLVFSIVLLLVFAGFILNPPSSVGFVRSTDATRGAFLFYGTAHHADSAMDILVPLMSALLWLSLRRRSRFWPALFAGMLVVAFLWHPREYFQLAIMVPIVALAFLVSRGTISARRLLHRMALLVGCVAVVGGGFFAAMNVERFQGQIGFDEMKLKKAALVEAIDPANLLGFRLATSIPNSVVIATPSSGGEFLAKAGIAKQFDVEARGDAWLLATGIAQIVLVLFGAVAARTLAATSIILWSMLMWNSACLLAIALTYSEILHSTPRLQYVFSYILVAEAALIVAQVGLCLVRERYPLPRPVRGARALVAGVALIAVVPTVIWVMKLNFSSLIRPLGITITAGIVIGLLTLLVRRHRPLALSPQAGGSPIIHLLVAVALIAPALVPRLTDPENVLWKGVASKLGLPLKSDGRLAPLSDGIRTSAGSANGANPAVAWFDDTNPFHLSAGLIAAVRILPEGSMMAANPLAMPFFSIYTPAFVFPSPFPVLSFLAEHEDVRLHRHPLFGRKSIEESEAIRYIERNRIQYVVVQDSDYDRLAPFFDARKEAFLPIYSNPLRRELVVRVTKSAGP